MAKNNRFRPDISKIFSETVDGKYTGVFIDDSGLPGLNTGTEYLTSERKTWVAVIVPPAIMPTVCARLRDALKDLTARTGATEFHFADIHGGIKQFKGVDLNYRLACFDLFASLFAKYSLPIYVQSLEPDDAVRIRSELDIPDKIGPLNMNKTEDVALFLLMNHVYYHLTEKRQEYGVPSRVFIDEGRAKHCVCMRWPDENIFADGILSFVKSSLCYPIQLADFAAYALTRNQWVMAKPNKTALDTFLAVLLSRLGPNYRNISSFPISDLSQMNPKEYARLTGQLKGPLNSKRLAHLKWRMRAVCDVLRNTIILHWRTHLYFWRSASNLFRAHPSSQTPHELSDDFVDLVRRVSPPDQGRGDVNSKDVSNNHSTSP